eukprot:3874568-Amphidinium_carterae.1
MLQALADPEKGHHVPPLRDQGAASHSLGQGLARPSPTWGGERVPARPGSAVAKAVPEMWPMIF